MSRSAESVVEDAALAEAPRLRSQAQPAGSPTRVGVVQPHGDGFDWRRVELN